MISSPRRGSVHVVPGGEFHPVDAHVRQEAGQILERERFVNVGERPAEVAFGRHRQRRDDGQPDHAAVHLPLRLGLLAGGVGAEHGDDDAVEAVAGDFGATR